MSDSTLRIPVTFGGFSFVIVDDGDGRYDVLNGSDYLEDPSGARLFEKNPDVQVFLKSMGKEQLHGTQVKPLGEFTTIWQSQVMMGELKSEETVWNVYQSLALQAQMAGINMSPDSAIFREFSRISGGYSCFVFLKTAEHNAGWSWRFPVGMDVNLAIAKKCIDEVSFADRGSAPHIISAKKTGYQNRINYLLQKIALYAEQCLITDMNEALAWATRTAAEGGVLDEFTAPIAAAKNTGYTKCVNRILQNAASAAGQASITSAIPDMQAELAYAKRVAKESGFYGSFERQFGEAMQSVYRIATENSLAQARDEVALANTRRLAQEGGILNEFGAKISATYLHIVIERLTWAKQEATHHYFCNSKYYVGEAKALAKKGGVGNHPEYLRLLKEVEAMIPK